MAANGSNHTVYVSDGTFDSSGGVDSIPVTTIQSALTPNGLPRNKLAWLVNGTIRDGGITPRGGFRRIGTIANNKVLYQGGYMYKPAIGNPYLVISLSGNIVAVPPDDPTSAHNISIEDSVQSVLTTGPWKVTLKNVNKPGDVQIYPPGTVFTSATAGYFRGEGILPPLGETFNPFVIPPIGGTVVVTGMNRPYFPKTNFSTGIGDIISLTGNFGVLKTIDITPLMVTPGHPATHQVIKFTENHTCNFEVIAADPAWTTISVDQPGNPPFEPKCFFCQAEEFLIIQAGDYESLPLFYDGSKLRRSVGITNRTIAPPGANGVNEIPPAGPMDYYMGRLWYAQRGLFSAGDVVGSVNSGSAKYGFRDSVLNVTESPLCFGGDGFTVPKNEGDITALSHNATQDSALGQGRIFAFTGKGVHSLIVPSTRTDWINADSTNQPLLTPIQLAQGTASDRSIAAVNGDLYYQSPQAEVRSILTAVRQFPDPGNRAISANENRLLKFTDASLLEFGTGMYFNNFLYQSALPINTPQGVVHQATTRLDFTPLSSFDVKGSAVWCGHDEGIDVLQYFTGIFDGEERAFAVAENRTTGDIDLWEITKQDRFDNSNDNDSDGTRIQMVIEYPAFTWQREFEQKELEGAFLWVDRVFGEVVFKLDYRTDGSTCWIPWHEWKICSSKNSCEDVNNPICYPILPNAECYKVPMALPRPPAMCETCNNLPSNRGYQFQPRFTVTGFCRVRGILLHGEFKHESIYNGIVCRLNA